MVDPNDVLSTFAKTRLKGFLESYIQYYYAARPFLHRHSTSEIAPYYGAFDENTEWVINCVEVLKSNWMYERQSPASTKVHMCHFMITILWSTTISDSSFARCNLQRLNEIYLTHPSINSIAGYLDGWNNISQSTEYSVSTDLRYKNYFLNFVFSWE